MSYLQASRGHRREHELEKAVERIDGGEISDDESDLDIVKTSAMEVDLLQALDGDQDTSSSSTENGGESRHRIKRRRRDETPTGERIGFSDDEEDGEDVYNKFKHRKSDQRKKAAARTRKAKAAAKESTGVGKRQTKIKLDDGKPATLKKHDTYGTNSDSEDESPETSLPQYLKQRRSKWESHRKELGDAGFKLPPEYDDINFTDEENLESLREKPDFPGAEPKRRYEDIELIYSAGIVPAPIAQWLRDYQVTGAEFLHEHFVKQKGGLLGDDMGLGKTIQVIAFLTAAFGKTGDERDQKRMRKMRRAQKWYPKVLIVCPGGLMDNWMSELDRWGMCLVIVLTTLHHVCQG